MPLQLIQFICFSYLITFLNEAHKSEKCSGTKFDLIIIYDMSGSLNKDKMSKQKIFVKDLILSTPAKWGNDYARCAVVKFNNIAQIHWDFAHTDHSEKTYMEKIDSLPNKGSGKTNFEESLKKVQTLLDQARQAIPHIVILITDGTRTEGGPPAREAEIVRHKGAIILAIGIAEEFDRVELKSITGTDKFIFQTHTFAELSADAFIQSLVSALCSTVTTGPQQVEQAASVLQTAKPTSAALTEKCSDGKFDVIFIYDMSGSLNRNKMLKQKTFVKDLILSTPVKWGNDYARCALVKFNSTAQIHWDFAHTDHNQKTYMEKIDSLPNQGYGKTNFEDSLKMVQILLDQARSSIPHIVILITDGTRTRGGPPANEAKKIRDKGAIILAIGIAEDFDRAELKTITGTDKFIFQTHTFAELSADAFIQSLVSALCSTVSTAITNLPRSTPVSIPIFTSVPTSTTTLPITTPTMSTTTSATTPTTSTTTSTTTTPTTSTTTSTTTPTASTTTSTTTPTTSTTPSTTTPTTSTTTSTATPTSTSTTISTTTTTPTTTTTTFTDTITTPAAALETTATTQRVTSAATTEAIIITAPTPATTSSPTKKTTTIPPLPVIDCFQIYVPDLESQLFARFGYF